MSYEEEKLLTEYQLLQEQYNRLKDYFEKNPEAKKKNDNGLTYFSCHSQALRVQAEKYCIFPDPNDSDDYILFRIIETRLIQLSIRLKQSKTGRVFDDTMSFIASITPQHVRGRIYKVENGEGCGLFCFWFLIIDALLVFGYYLISGGW